MATGSSAWAVCRVLPLTIRKAVLRCSAVQQSLGPLSSGHGATVTPNSSQIPGSGERCCGSPQSKNEDSLTMPSRKPEAETPSFRTPRGSGVAWRKISIWAP